MKIIMFFGILYVFFTVIILLSTISLIYSHVTQQANVKTENYTKFTNVQAIPKVIWTYWSDPEIPESVKLCIKTWRYYNPTYDVVVLNRENMSTYVDIDIYALRNVENDVRASDFLRVYLLQKHGGVWMDSTIICTKSLDWLIHRDNMKDYIGFFMGAFTTDSRYPVIENWFMACPADSDLMFKVYSEFMRMNEFDSVDQYVKDVKDSGVDIQNIPFPEYLAMHIAFQKVLQTSKPYDLGIIDARGDNGPFFYLNENGWNSEKALNMLCQNNDMKTPLIKLRGDERKLVEEGKADINCFRVEGK